MTLLLLVPSLVGLVPDAPDFDRDVRPILADRCYTCHGPDAATRRAALRLDLPGDLEFVAEAGQRARSELFRRITSDDPDERMPPPEAGPALEPLQIETLGAWIDAGLEWSSHWSFVAPTPPPLPAVGDPAWLQEPLDRFVAARLEREGLAPSPEADAAKLLRRVTLDLTGLPPTLDQLDAFTRDPSDAAYRAAVERLLASPGHAERLATWWLDGARYADTNGYQNDFARAQWPWRDWVIDAFQANMPFDRFALEQLAGDLLEDATLEQRVATGFGRNHRTVTEAGSIDEEWRVENVVDRVETTSAVFLGLTLGCARCHDHKFDPISQDDFYGFYAFFNSSADQGVYEETRGNAGPRVRVPSAADTAALAELDARLGAARRELELRREDVGARRDAWLQRSGSTAPAALEFAPRLALGAFDLDGESEHQPQLGQAFAADAARPLGVSVWLRPDQVGVVLSKMADDDTYRGFDVIVFEDGRAGFHLIHDWPENGLKVVTRGRVVAGEWTHLALSYDGSSRAAGVTIWLDGHALELELAADTLDGSVATDEPLRLGRRRYAPSYAGRIEDLRVFERTLAAPDVELLRAQFAWRLARAERAEDLALVFEQSFDEALFEARRGVDELALAREELDAAVPTVMVLEELPEPRQTFVLKRGRYDGADEARPVAPALPGFLPGWGEGAPPDRLGLARWIVSPHNPLTARVTVNRIWHELFGVGLVETLEDFGVQGARPSHPELLDYLALEFVRGGWDLRALLRSIVHSATYRQDSSATPAERERDPANRLLARGPRFRLPAEAIRDSALFAAGLLVERLGGPPVRPYQPEGLWKELAGGAGQGPYVEDEDDGLWRRSLYVHRKRTVPHPLLATFDAPSWEFCRLRRTPTNTPLQALALLNDPTYVEAARHLAGRMLRAARTDSARLAHGFRLVTSRAPRADELALLEAGLATRRARFAARPDEARALLGVGRSPVEADAGPGPEPDPTELAAFTLSASVLLNLDEALTRE